MKSAAIGFRKCISGNCATAMTHQPSFGTLAWFILLAVILGTMNVAVSAEETVWQDIAGELMSPACPGRTLLNCTSEHAGQWQELIKQKVVQGVPKDEIMQYFVKMGGEEVLASPPKRGFTLTVWLLPAFAIVNGIGLIILLTTRWAKRDCSEEQRISVSGGRHPQRAPSSTSDSYLSRVRRDLQDV